MKKMKKILALLLAMAMVLGMSVTSLAAAKPKDGDAEKVTINDSATAVNISPKECIRSFKKNIHQTPIEYLLNYRVEQAKKLLRHSELSITDIALRAGFSTSAYFSKIFKERVGMTLREYRQRQG